MIDPADWKLAAEHMLRRVDRHTVAPIYLVDRSEVTGDVCGQFVGLTGPAMDLLLLPTLEASGQWQGRGFAAIVDVEATQRQLAAASIVGRRPLLSNLLGIVLHEYAHFVAEGLTEGIGEREVATLLATPGYEQLLPLTIAPSPTEEPWARHGIRFGRAIVHLWSRASWTGWRWQLEDLWQTRDFYGLGPAMRYADVLSPELLDRSQDPLVAIVAEDPPADLVELFESDVCDYRSNEPAADAGQAGGRP